MSLIPSGDPISDIFHLTGRYWWQRWQDLRLHAPGGPRGGEKGVCAVTGNLLGRLTGVETRRGELWSKGGEREEVIVWNVTHAVRANQGPPWDKNKTPLTETLSSLSLT